MNPVLLYGLYAVIGRLLIWIIQTAGPFEVAWNLLEARWPKFQEMHECGWCIGVYTYPILAYLLNINVFDNLTHSLVGYILTGVITSFIAQALYFGIKDWFNWQ